MKMPRLLIWVILSLSVMSCDNDDGNPVDAGTVVAYGGKNYHTVKIGNQRWLKENLDIGTMIAGDSGQADNGTLEKYCYNDDENNCAIYGGLYQWYEAMQYVQASKVRGICPQGWHIPSATEFDALRTAVGGKGNALKALGQGQGSGAGTNTSGFSALLAGIGISDGGGFGGLGVDTYFWSSSEIDPDGAYALYLYDLSSYVYLDGEGYNNHGFSVRCLED